MCIYRDSLNNLCVIDSEKHVMSCSGSARMQTSATLSLWGSSRSGIIKMNRTESSELAGGAWIGLVLDRPGKELEFTEEDVRDQNGKRSNPEKNHQ